MKPLAIASKRILGRWTLIGVVALLVGTVLPSEAQLLGQKQVKYMSGGIEAGGLMGQTELNDKFAAQIRAFLRLRLTRKMQIELGVGSGRIAGDEFGTDMMLLDSKVVFNALVKENWTPLFIAVGLGVLRYDLDKIAPGRTALADPTGWSAMVPIEAGTQLVLLKNVAFEVKASFTHTFSDDLNSFNSGQDNDSFGRVTAGLVMGHLQRK